jgi:hypothetical protein
VSGAKCIGRTAIARLFRRFAIVGVLLGAAMSFGLGALAAPATGQGSLSKKK